MNPKTTEIPFAPIFRPSLTEFSNFKSFVYNLAKNPDVRLAGCAKVV